MHNVSLIALFLGVTMSAVAAASGKSGRASGDLGQTVNGHLAAVEVDFRLEKAECFGAPGHIGTLIVFNNRGNKQSPSQFVPGDPDRGGNLDITWISDAADGATASGLTAADTYQAIQRAMATWEGVECSTIPLTGLGSGASDLGVVEFIVGLGGSPFVFADYTHAGWLPASFFEAMEAGGGSSILATTFTFIWIDSDTGEPTDIDRNGKTDVAFRETYYNDGFPWAIDSASFFEVDVETVALHEAGHGLSQEHFGSGFVTLANGKGHLAPFAVMNAGYIGLQHQLTGSDIGGHCSLWAAWPH